MLCSALKDETSSVYMDVLTAQDLEELKRKKLGAAAPAVPTTSTKRYLILTSANDFDKVHYPLPLSYEENPDVETMKRTISRLSSAIESYRSKAVSVASPGNFSDIAKASFYSEASVTSNNFNATSRTVEEIKGENEKLRRKLALLERTNSVQDEDTLSRLEQHKSVDRYLEGSRVEMRTLTDRLNESQQKLRETQSELFKAKSELGRFEQLRELPPPEVLRVEIARLKKELEAETKTNSETISKQKEVLEVNMKELDKAKENDKQLRSKIKELEGKLDEAVKRNSYSMYRNRSNSNASNRSNSSYKYSPSQSRVQNNKRSSSVPQKKPIVRPSPNTSGYNRNAGVSGNKYQPRYSPVPNRSNSGNRAGYNSGASSKYGYGRSNQGVQGNRQSPGVARRSPGTNLYGAARKSPVTYGAARRSPVTNAYGGSKRNPAVNNKVSPLRAANQERLAIPPANDTWKKSSPGVFSRLYNPTGSKARAKESSNIDDRLRNLQNIIKAAK
eukprot:TRINITY_DN1447_c0_g1_i13.p1 TRINITY_DN1447_c0_g1~~TRINITY_DN1447_c0_g1_i13.p1  ORF type:complete len:503 (+),score=119.14 TRINITY_DN1447_c0_g1_i13:245-1753(+)